MIFHYKVTTHVMETFSSPKKNTWDNHVWPTFVLISEMLIAIYLIVSTPYQVRFTPIKFIYPLNPLFLQLSCLFFISLQFLFS